MPNNKKKWEIKIVGFVDDKKHYVNNVSRKTKDTLEQAMQKSIRIWEELLNFTGGKLELSKCEYFLIKWGFDNKDKPFIENNKYAISFSNPGGSPIESKQLHLEEQMTYLGVTSQVNGKQDAITTKLCKIADQITRTMASSHLPHYYSHIYFKCKINPKLTYPLAATSMTEQQTERLHRKLYPEVIASKGFNRNWPTRLRYGNHKYSGLGLINYKVEQSVKKLEMLHKLLNHPKHTLLIQGLLSWYQLSLGISTQALANPPKGCNYVSSIWFGDLVEFLSIHKIKVVTEKFISLNMQRSNDKCIMDEILRLHLTKNKLIRINACRLYLQITHLSDITESDGKTINKNFLTGPKPKFPRSIFKWPNQPFPSK